MLVDKKLLEYSVEWGGSAWLKHLREAFEIDLNGWDIENKSVLEIGTRRGKMACMFAEIGAKRVVGVDLLGVDLSIAQGEAKRLGIEEQVEFVNYDGDLDSLTDEKFDLIFCKSVLVVVPELDKVLRSINNKLTTNGKFLFLENGDGGHMLRMVRQLRHRDWDSSAANFVGSEFLSSVERNLCIESVTRSYLPPVYKIFGSKK